jgi:hypothetical protein
MAYFIIATWDADNHPTSINHKETEAEAKAIVAKIGGFYVESEDYDVPSNYITVDPDNKSIVVDTTQRDKDIVIANSKIEIRRLESTVTARRMRDALASDEGKVWVANIEDKIKSERAKL